MFLLDCHNHTTHSFDGKSPLAVMCDEANAKGFAVYTVTEHYDCGWVDGSNAFEGVLSSHQSIDAYKAAHPTGTKILKGIELGQMLHFPEDVKRIMDAAGNDFDFVLASLHNIKGEKDFCQLDYHAYGAQKMDGICEQYFTELYEMSKVGGFDSVGHITYPYRYAKRREFPIQIDKYDEIIAAMMKNLIEKGIALEVNTSGYRQGLDEPMPGRHHLQMYKDLGGELLTIGSDAHIVTDFGGGIETGLELIKELGFDYITYFEQRKPIMVKL